MPQSHCLLSFEVQKARGAVDSGREFFYNDFLHLGWTHGFYIVFLKFESSLDSFLVLASDLVLPFLCR